MDRPAHTRVGLLLAAFVIPTLFTCALTSGQEAEPGDSSKAKGGFTDPPTELSQIRVPPGFKVEVFAAEPRVQNPSAFHIDEKGRFYVVEANRRKNGTLDMRSLPTWVEEDLASRSVGDRIAMVKRHYGADAKQMAAMTEQSDRIRLIEDRDGDGKADFDTIFADGFNRLENGTAAGVLGWHGNVYFTEIPDLWLLRDAKGTGNADERKSLAWGFGVHYTYSGHDMHGLRVGPDGRIYWSIADRGARVEKDGKILIDNPDSGAVFRCEPDGSNIELFATGLRNPQELAFDQYGNLFTGDNNADAGDATRWVYVLEGSDNGWRTPYQYHEYPVGRGIWMSEKPWLVDPPVPANYRVPPVANVKISGPAGLTYNPGTGMPKAFDDSFLLVDFRGGPSNSGVYALRNKPKGAGFELVEEKVVVGNVLPTDVEFGYRGGFYFTSWVSGWEPKKQGRIYHAFDPTTAKEAIVEDTRRLMARGMAGRKPEELAKLLGHSDMRVRLEAQFELAGRGNPSVLVLKAAAEQGDNQLSRIHAIWGLGQIGRRHVPFVYSPGPQGEEIDALEVVAPLLADKDAEVRAQAARVLGDTKYRRAGAALTKALSDKSPRVRYFAAVAVGRIGLTDALPQVLAMLKKNGSQDPFLRHGGVMALAGMDRNRWDDAGKDPSGTIRLAAVLALRRLGDHRVAQFLQDPDPEIVLEAARAINDVPIPEAMLDLTGLSNATPAALPEPFRTPVLRRVLNAGQVTGHGAEVAADFSTRNDVPVELRVEALHALATWDQLPARDRVSALFRTPHPNGRKFPPHDPAAGKTAFAAVLPKLLETAPDAVKIAALNAAAEMGLQSTPLAAIVSDAKASPGLRAAALGAMAARKDRKTADAVKLALADPNEALRVAAIGLQPKQPDGLTPLKAILDTGTPREQQAVLQALGAVTSKDKNARNEEKEADAMLVAAFDRLDAGKLPPEAELDLLTAAGTRKTGAVAQRLKQYNAAQAKAVDKDPLAAYRPCLAGGDARQGEYIFRERQDVSCMRCHSIRGVGGNAGPDLAGVLHRAGDRYRNPREYILESILYPNQTIAPGFETVTVNTGDDVVSGVIKGEDDKQITLDVPNVGVTKIDKSKVKSRKGGLSAMPEDIAKSLSKQDLRDLVEFLSGAE